MVTLTAGGRSAASVTAKRTQVELFDAWDAAINRMLSVAAAQSTAHARIEQMQIWLANNEWHDKYAERHSQYWTESMAANVISGQLMDMTIEVSNLQRRFDADWITGLSALVGCELYPNIAQRFAVWARKTGSDDLFEVVRAWQMAEWEQDKTSEEAINDPG